MRDVVYTLSLALSSILLPVPISILSGFVTYSTYAKMLV